MTDRWIIRQLAWHALTGAALGSALAFLLLACNCAHLLDLVRGRTAPLALAGGFVAGLAMCLASGAAVTGFPMILQQGESE